MPDYKYFCMKCNYEEILNRKMSEYKSNEPCTTCGELMDRKTEDLICGDYVAKCSGFYGKKSV